MENANTSHFVYGDEHRIFVNTDMGCEARCKYCYLPRLGIVHGERRISAEEAISLALESGYYVEGAAGTIISIGCYSECMDSQNIDETAKVVSFFLKKGNYVQLATKKRIQESFLKRLKEDHNPLEKLWVYISMPVVTDHKSIELGTDSPAERKRNFALCKKYKVNSVLYIKPYLDGVTNKDMEYYREIVVKYSVPVVVGELLTLNENDCPVLVGEKRLYGHQCDVKDFAMRIKGEAGAFFHSTECIEQLRGDEK